MADTGVKKVPNDDGASERNSDRIVHAAQISDKGESLEDLLTTLSQQINNSDWLQQNTAEKFAAENPEVAQAFKDAALNSQENGGDIRGGSA